jgi:hypothetical protein
MLIEGRPLGGAEETRHRPILGMGPDRNRNSAAWYGDSRGSKSGWAAARVIGCQSIRENIGGDYSGALPTRLTWQGFACPGLAAHWPLA